MPTPVAPNTPAARIVDEEIALWEKVLAFLQSSAATQSTSTTQHDAELIELRDAIAEAKPEDLPPLIEQMARVSAVAAGRRGKVLGPVDMQAPYFAHLRLRPSGQARAGAPARDVLIGRRGIIDRAAGIQIVDWRDAPVSQIYYRYEEGDDYDELIGGTPFQGEVEIRRNVTIQGGRLRRIGCPQGTFFIDQNDDTWWQSDTVSVPSLSGGQGSASRAPRGQPVPARPTSDKTPRPGGAAQLGSGGARIGFAERVDKHMPEIAALIDKHQFSLITEPDSGVVVIQGGAGSGKTTVALHRVAFLSYQKPERFRGTKVMVIVPSEALVRYVSGVLPSLGVPGVPVITCASWLRHHRQRLLPHLPKEQTAETPPTVARLKKHPLMLKVLDDYVADHATALRTQLAQAMTETAEGGAAHGIGPAAAERVLAEWDARAGRPLRSRCRGVRSALGTLPAGLLSTGAQHRLDELLRRLSRRAGDVARDWAELLTDPERLWRGLGPSGDVSRVEIAELVEYCQAQQEEVEELTDDVDKERFQAVDGQPLDDDSPAGTLDLEDDALLLRLFQLKYGGLEHSSGKGFVRYEHMVLDEVQDLSALEVKTLISCVGIDDKGRLPPNTKPSITMAGDVAQRLIFDNGFSTWQELLETVGLPGVQLQRLRIMYRSTAEVMGLSRAVLGPLMTSDSEQEASRHGAPVRAFGFSEPGEAVAFLGEALRSLLAREPTASVALIARHTGTADLFYRGLQRTDVPSLRRVQRHEFTFAPGVDVTDVTQVKGLEFDYVVLLDATAAAYPDATEARHLLHIAMTRCAHQLWLIATGTPSPLIPREYFDSAYAAV